MTITQNIIEAGELLRGPDSVELETDLAKVEHRLCRLDAEDVFSPAERKLERLYYLHWQKRLQLFLTREGGSFKKSEHAPQETTGVLLNHVKQSDESWKVITPRALVRAVMKIREDFEHSCDVQRGSVRDRCFKDLHDLAFGMTEPAVFKNHFFLCIERIRRIVAHTFGRFLRLALSQNGLIGAASIHWASLQITDLIEREDRIVEGWIKSVCDKLSDVRITGSQEFVEKVVFWTDWRAPRWLIMWPNRNAAYDRSKAWERMNEHETRSVLRHLREHCWSSCWNRR